MEGFRVRSLNSAQDWNPLVASFPITSALQSWGWGQVKRASGWEPLRLVVEDSGQPVAAVQILRRRLSGSLWMAYAPRGPALYSLDQLPAVALALRPALRGAIYLKLEAETPQDHHFARRLAPLRPSETIQPEFSVWLDLRQGEASVLAGMSSMHRRNTRLAQKRVERTIAGTEAFEAFWELFEATNQRARLLQHARSYYQTVLEVMQQPLGQAFISLAHLEGDPLAAGLFVAFAGKIDYLYGGSSRAQPELKAPAGMHWEAIQWGLAQGCSIYDLWGVPRQTEGSHAAGIDRFKEGFGGSRVRFPAYDLSLSPLYPSLRTAIRWRKQYVNWRTRGQTRDVLG
jgi:lipid II:glycine glycyltransferase (peptidoglycan interpeptide bridge formation enzyme)